VSAVRLLTLLVTAAALASGCGGEAGGAERGEATLWVTRDRGATVLLEREVAAGATVVRTLRDHAEVETSHGGRFVTAIEGVAASPGEGSDWFYFVNGLLADRGAAEYRVRPGDVIWWDHRTWADEREEVRAVVGAFPEPFLHGYAGRTRPAAVTYELPGQERAARRLAEVIGAGTVVREGSAPAGAHVLALVSGPPRFVARSESVDGPVRFELAGDADALADDPHRYRFEFEVRP
jgi:hypothetical protein